MEFKLEDIEETFNGEIVSKISSNEYLIKIQNNLLSFERIYKCGNAKIKILKPDWI